MSRTAIVIVTFNSAGVILRCLKACRAQCPAALVVVDNASSDRTVEEIRRFPGVRLIANRANAGFAGAVNQAVRATSEPFILLLNPDTEILGGLEDLEAACSEPGVAASAGLLVSEDGVPQRGFSVRRFPSAGSLIFETLGVNRLWPSNPVNRRYRCLDLDLARAQEVEQPAGAFLMFRRDAWRQLGGFDEAFHPVWFEDVDFCRRLALAGYRTRLVPAAAARHQGGHSIRGAAPADRVVWWHKSLLEYITKHLPAGPGRLAACAIIVSAALRAVTGIFAGSGGGEVAGAYGRVMSLAWKCLWSGRTGAGMSEAGAPERTTVGDGSAEIGE